MQKSSERRSGTLNRFPNPAQTRVLASWLASLDRGVAWCQDLLDLFYKTAARVRLSQEVEARYGILDIVFRRAVARRNKNLQLRLTLPKILAELSTSAPWKNHVCNDEVNRLAALCVKLYSLNRVRSRQDGKASALENAARGFAHKWLVFNKEDRTRARVTGGARNCLHGVLWITLKMPQ